MTDDKLDDFRDPAKLKAFFDEVDGDIANLSDRIRDANRQNDALQMATLAILTALDDTMPTIRTLVVQTLDEEISRILDDRIEHSDPDEKEERVFVLSELSTKIDLDNKLIRRE